MRDDKGGTRRWSDRAEDEADASWLAAQARGEPAEHPDPARAASYVRLERALGSLPTHRGDPNFASKVLAQIDRRSGLAGTADRAAREAAEANRRARRERMLWRLGAALVALAAFVLAYLWGARP